MLRISEIVQSIQSEEDLLEQVAIIDHIIRQDSLSDSKKSETRNLLMILRDIVNDRESEPVSKYYSMHIVKHFADKKYPTFITDLAYSALFEDMVRILKTVDPEKQLEEKGRTLFPGEAELGTKYLNLIAKCVVEWGENFPIAENMQSSKFKKSLEELRTLKVVLPNISNESTPGSEKRSFRAEKVFEPLSYMRYPSSYVPQGEEVIPQPETLSNKRPSAQGFSNILGQGNFSKKNPETEMVDFFSKISKPSAFTAMRQQIVSPPQVKKNESITKYKKQKEHSRFNVSRKSNDISQMFPHIKLDKNDYHGVVVTNDLAYWEQMAELQPDEIKKFKTASFKDKSILYQDEALQIGFKSKLIYENVENFKMFLKIILYYDNRGQGDIVDLENQFFGDQTNLLYSTKRKIESRIICDDQNTQEILVVPLDIVMSLIQMRISYTYKGTQHRAEVFLPNTVLKFTEFRDLEKGDFVKRMDQRKNSILRTDPFKLSRHFSPQVVKKNLPDLVEMTSYNEFLQQKSYMQYQLGGHCEVVKTEEYLLRVIMRIDNKAVIQILPLQSSGQSVQYGKFLLQTMQFLLQEDSI